MDAWDEFIASLPAEFDPDVEASLERTRAYLAGELKPEPRVVIETPRPQGITWMFENE